MSETVFSCVSADFSKPCGAIKPMHAVNNAPYGDIRGTGNGKYFAEAGIPFARNHDASFCASYGGEHCVDVKNIFPDFDADENDPASYDFFYTDEYIERAEAAGVTVYYRLGNRIEHEFPKYGTLPPKDFRKWARICEHIIAHYVEGWADGYTYDMPYWEIWNEYNNVHQNGDNPCWGGTFAQFYDFFEIAAKHLKARFPHLKIGGPALTSSPGREAANFLHAMHDRQVPLDFFSFHRYTTDPYELSQNAFGSRALLDKYGYTDTELHLNEWNYVEGWGEELKHSVRIIPTARGAAFVAAGMLVCQGSPLDMLMYYDAQPKTNWNGLFEKYTGEPQKPYYAFTAFGELYRLGQAVAVSSDDPDLFIAAATDGEKGAVMFAYYAKDPTAAEKTVTVDLIHGAGAKKATVRLLDGAHDLVPVETRYLNGTRSALTFTVAPDSVILLAW